MTAAPAPLDTASGETTRDRLLAAAAAVFAAQGYDGARLQDIARAAGLTTGAVYANFRGKDDLLVAAIGTRAGDELAALLAGGSGREVPVLLESLAGRLVDAPGPSPLLVDATAAARRDPSLAATLRRHVATREDALAALVDRARADGSLAADLDPDTFARFCVTLALGALMMRTLGVAPADRSEWHALISRLLGAVTEEPEVEPLREEQP